MTEQKCRISEIAETHHGTDLQLSAGVCDYQVVKPVPNVIK